MMKIAEITEAISAYAPIGLQESYDNAGMQVGDPEAEATGALLCVDVTEAIVEEARKKGLNLIISHHPLLFHGLKRITGDTQTERIVKAALKWDISIYSAHTNMDNAAGGVSDMMAEKLGLEKRRVLSVQQGRLYKMVVFVPEASADAVATAMHEAGAGHIGNYDKCSYRMRGEGRFRALEGANPWVGERGELHKESEVRLEVLVDSYNKGRVEKRMLSAHPYEEPAYDIIALANDNRRAGSGIVGELPEAVEAKTFIQTLKATFGSGAVKYSGNVEKKVRTVALCGGSGSEFIGAAVGIGADIYVTGDLKYHDYTTYNDKILLADIGHYESEQCTKEIFNNVIRKKFPNFATYYAELEKNPINYL